MISSFPWRNRKYFLVFEYPGTNFTIDHFKDGLSLYLSFTSHKHFERLVSFACLLSLRDFLWIKYCFFKFSLAIPRHTLFGLTVVQAMYYFIISLAWQLPSIGQSFFLQLHWFFDVSFSLVTFLSLVRMSLMVTLIWIKVNC